MIDVRYDIRRRPRVRRAREEGAVMFLVMLMLLMGTATAIFAMHTTTYEVRASGYGRQQMQTQNIGEAALTATMAWTDFITPQVMREQWLVPCANANKARPASGGIALDLSPFEPPLDPSKNACRLYADDFAVMSPTERVADWRSSIGPRQPFNDLSDPTAGALILVDVYEDYDSGEVVQGQDMGGSARFINLDVTFTARGRTRLPGDVVSAVAGDRAFHEGAADGRVFAVTGPLMVTR